MTIKDEVLAAFEKLDATDDALWNKDGTPKLEAIRAVAKDERISREEMIGSIGDKRRPAQKAKAETPAAPPADPAPAAAPAAASAPAIEPPAAAAPAAASAPAIEPPAADKPDEVNTQKPQVANVDTTETPDKMKLVNEAKAALADIEAQAKEANTRKAAVDSEVALLEQQRVAFQRTLDDSLEHLTHADAVKRVQAQTLKNLAANKERIGLATQALQSAGLKTTAAASPLDAAYQARKKSPEQATAAAQFIQQQQRRRLNERLGT